MPTILDRIVATKREEITAAKAMTPLAEQQARAADRPPARDFLAAVTRPGAVRLIAEVKKASPSKGVIRADFDPVAIARTYESAGASALSVLTDSPYFQGDLSYLSAIRAAVELPLLRKDFILDIYQVHEARAAGADAVLLIAECLTPAELKTLHDEIVRLGMTPLVELYDPENLPAVLDCGAKLIGVNNRNLHTFEVDLHHTVRLREQIPSDRAVVGESGIASHDDLQLLAEADVQAVLVGESLMRQPDIAMAVRTLLGTTA
jgi:indole-3-glycerol phosphate synthase